MTEESEKLINNFLQKDVVFFINKEKPIKTGKLLIFKFKDFYFNFILKNNKKCSEHLIYLFLLFFK